MLRWHLYESQYLAVNRRWKDAGEKAESLGPLVPPRNPGCHSQAGLMALAILLILEQEDTGTKDLEPGDG